MVSRRGEEEEDDDGASCRVVMATPMPVRRAPPRSGPAVLVGKLQTTAGGGTQTGAHCIKRVVEESFPFPFHSIQSALFKKAKKNGPGCLLLSSPRAACEQASI